MATLEIVTLREAKAEDATRLAEVLNAAFAPLRSIYRPTIEALALQAERDQELTRLVVEIEGRIVGTVQFTNDQKQLHVIGLAVHPEFQRQGIARRLVERAVTHARRLGHKTIALNTIKETGNVPRFEKFGFQVTQEEVATWCLSEVYPELHDVKMERDIV